MTTPAEENVLENHLDPVERDLEAPSDDAAEQAAPAKPAETPPELRRGMEVGEWDAFEQSVVIDFEDDYDR